MPEKRRKLKIVILLSAIWFACAIPVPFLIASPQSYSGQGYTYLGIVILVSIPFVAMGIAWSLKPELTTRS